MTCLKKFNNIRYLLIQQSLCTMKALNSNSVAFNNHSRILDIMLKLIQMKASSFLLRISFIKTTQHRNLYPILTSVPHRPSSPSESTTPSRPRPTNKAPLCFSALRTTTTQINSSASKAQTRPSPCSSRPCSFKRSRSGPSTNSNCRPCKGRSLACAT